MPEDATTVWAALQALPGDERQLVERIVIEGESEVKIACEVGASRSTVNRLKRSALKKLRICLERNRKDF